MLRGISCKLRKICFRIRAERGQARWRKVRKGGTLSREGGAYGKEAWPPGCHGRWLRWLSDDATSLDPVCDCHLWILTALPVACCFAWTSFFLPDMSFSRPPHDVTFSLAPITASQITLLPRIRPAALTMGTTPATAGRNPSASWTRLTNRFPTPSAQETSRET